MRDPADRKSFADQLNSEGQTDEANKYAEQATMMKEQAQNFDTLATKYNDQAKKILKALPSIHKFGLKARSLATWKNNPTDALSVEKVYPYTVAPPLAPETLPTEEPMRDVSWFRALRWS